MVQPNHNRKHCLEAFYTRLIAHDGGTVACCARIVVLALLLAQSKPALGTIRNEYESAKTTWSLREHDGQVRVLKHQRTFNASHSGNGSEFLQFVAGPGSKVLWAEKVDPTPVINELDPSIWVKSNRRGVRMMIRVVFPRTPHPKDPTGKMPVTYLLHSPAAYELVGRWQELKMKNARELLKEKLPAIASEIGREVQIEQAYVDHIVLNTYTGAGPSEVWIDDLTLNSVDATVTPQGQLASSPINRTPSDETVEIRNGRIVVQGKPFVPRIIEHQGENFAALRDLGFNTIALKVPPTAEQVRHARTLGLWFICPPPASAETETISHPRVLFWSLGEDLQRRHWDRASQIASAIRRSNPLAPPLLAHPTQALPKYGQILDAVRINAPTVGTALPWQKLRDDVAARLNATRRGVFGVVGISTEVPYSLERQQALLGSVNRVPWSLEPAQMRHAVLLSALAGARGFYFTSKRPLKEDDLDAKIRMATLRWVNLELDLLHPWIAEGTDGGYVGTNRSNMVAGLRTTQRARVLIGIDTRENGHYVQAFDGSSPNAVLAVQGIRVADQAFRLHCVDLDRARVDRTREMRLSSVGDQGVHLAFFSQDAVSMAYTQRKLREQRNKRIGIRLHLNQLLLAQQEALLHNLPGTAPGRAALQRAVEQAKVAQRRLQSQSEHNPTMRFSKDFVAFDAAMSAARLAVWQPISQPFTIPASSPLAASLMVAPLHWSLGQRISQTQWSGSVLAAGDMEDLNRMQKNGWQQIRGKDKHIQTTVELSLERPQEGRYSLHLSSRTLSTGVPLSEPPVTIRSSAIRVRQGDLVKIQGWVRCVNEVDSRVASDNGILIYDSLGGSELGLRFQNQETWQPFVLYRAAATDQTFRVHMELNGVGDVWLDGVSVHLIEKQ